MTAIGATHGEDETRNSSSAPFDRLRPKLTEFLWSTRDEPHKERRRRIMKAHPEVIKLVGIEPMTKYIVVALVLFQYSVAIAIRDHVGTFSWFLVTYFIGCTITHSLFLATHEIVHNLALRNTCLSKLLGIFTQLPIPIAYAIDFREYHFEHHKLQGDEAVDTDLPTAWEGRFFQGPVLKFIYLALILLFYAIRPLFVRPKKPTMWHLFNWIAVLAVNGYITKIFGWGVLAYQVAALIMCSMHPSAGHFIAEHMVFKGEAETYSYYGWLNLVTFNVGYHNEHHDFPGVPWTRLPAIKAMCPEFYDNIPCHHSWSMVMYRFVTMPNVTPFNRIKRNQIKKFRKQD